MESTPAQQPSKMLLKIHALMQHARYKQLIVHSPVKDNMRLPADAAHAGGYFIGAAAELQVGEQGARAAGRDPGERARCRIRRWCNRLFRTDKLRCTFSGAAQTWAARSSMGFQIEPGGWSLMPLVVPGVDLQL
ncbi:hypothetical protein [Parasphingorhabdus sp.]|uniref:hypothetical protein n=1 Tax=Parasphingorhabdus sp. TaxID=2709688 RepID=UPI003A95748E